MSKLGSTLLGLFCLFGSQHVQAESAVCNGDGVCIGDSSGPGGARPRPLSPGASFAVQERCSEAAVNVTAALADERRLACSAADDAVRLLGRCHIFLRRPLHLQIVSQVRHPFDGAVFGLFDTKKERVLVTDEANIAALVAGTPYAELPQRDFYRSLIVHEVVHGVMHQSFKRQPTSHAAYEYPAYALQIESLPPVVRERFLRSFDRTTMQSSFMFNDSLLFFDPYFFAARAYEHFNASADRCADLAALLDGKASFIAPTM